MPTAASARQIHSALPILDFDESAARWQAEQRARLRKIGKSSYPDSQIASIAATKRDFGRLRGLWERM